MLMHGSNPYCRSAYTRASAREHPKERLRLFSI